MNNLFRVCPTPALPACGLSPAASSSTAHGGAVRTADALTVPIASVFAMTKQRPDFELNRPGAVIAALPAVLGFVPEKSLVLISIDDGELGSVMRVDLSDALADRIGQLAEVASAAGPEAAIAVIVDADGAGCPMCNEEYRDLCATLTERAVAARHRAVGRARRGPGGGRGPLALRGRLRCGRCRR